MDLDRARVPDGARVYAIGDIHGRVDLLAELHKLIRRDARERPAARATVVYLGDFIDRGPDSAGVIDFLLDRSLEGFGAVHLRGNHEATLLDFLENVSIGPNWLFNGGDATLNSYGIAISRWEPDPVALRRTQEEFRAALPPRHAGFYRGLGLQHREGDYLFVHAGIRPGVGLAEQTPYDLMWIRQPFLESEADHGVVVVHGHTITRKPELRTNRIGIDTGAYYSGRLTCLVLEGATRRFLHT